MADETKGPAAITADRDALGEAVAKAILPECVFSRPGMLRFRVGNEDGESEMSFVLVARSRFEGDYGSICRVVPVGRAGLVGQTTFVPTFAITGALSDTAGGKTVFERLLDVYRQWLKGG